MGAYLSEPKTTKDSSDTEGGRVRCGASSMQGWRISQEDAHNCILDFDKEASLFAVYDGHGGHEVAEYCSKHLPDFLKKMEKYTKGEFEQALKDAFLEFDATLTTAEVIEVLKTIAGRKDDTEANPGCGGADGESESEEEEAIDNLVQEAHMPLDQVMAKYAAAGPLYRVLKGEGGKPPVSPMLRGRRACDAEAGGSGACSSSGEPSCSAASASAGSSSSKSVKASAKGDAEVSSSSSQPAPLCNGESHTNGEVEEVDSVSGNEAKAENTEKPSEKPAAGKREDKAKLNSSEADSSEVSNGKGESHDASASSCSEADVSSSSPTSRQKRMAAGASAHVYQKLLQDESESEEEDETFTADAAESDDSDDAAEDVEGKEEEEEEDSSVEEEEEDEEDDEEYPGMDVKEEPGSDSGCTAVVALLAGSQLYVANAGDSRCVLCRDGKAVELSVDHKPEDEPERLRIENAGGKVTNDGRVNGGLNLSRAIGDHAYKQVKLLPASQQMITALPDIQTLTIDPDTDEFMVLACDGIWNSMTSQEVVDFVRVKLQQKTERLSQICEELFDHCLAPNTIGDGTGCDNMTCVIVQFKQPGSAKRAAAEGETEEPCAKKTKVEEEVTST